MGDDTEKETKTLTQKQRVDAAVERVWEAFQKVDSKEFGLKPGADRETAGNGIFDGEELYVLHRSRTKVEKGENEEDHAEHIDLYNALAQLHAHKNGPKSDIPVTKEFIRGIFEDPKSGKLLESNMTLGSVNPSKLMKVAKEKGYEFDKDGDDIFTELDYLEANAADFHDKAAKDPNQIPTAGSKTGKSPAD